MLEYKGQPPYLAFARYRYVCTYMYMYCMYIADTFDFSRFMEARSTMNRRRGGGREICQGFFQAGVVEGDGIHPLSKLLHELYRYV